MSYIDKQALRISELEELNELLREKVKKLESDLWDKEQLRQVYSEKSFNLDSKVRELEARNQKDFVWRGNEISRLNDEVDELKEKLEAANRRSAELGRDCWTYENTVKTLLERAESAESACTEAARILKSGERMALTRAVNILLSVGECATSYQYPVVLPEPIGWKSPSGHEVLKKKDVIAALMSAGVPVEGD
ncbi:hypothetical protein PQY04_000989 [Salmonella enterica]|uniref:Ead/Ea22-like family protein n=1 Tax=Salmonella enterica TaxID=28901 RepID=A0A3J3C1N0_SALER|nr:hypothetical protein [Salmonella enterica]EBI0348847.1 hypothetical protein [Salmonella enterica subsp. arizonae serovar 48:z4,z23,z32:-]EBX4071341.1 hypothetical protein [Salmonella enterica subsp. enterica serovar Richmond]EBZ6086204.1 hypothetical protein [Salmonella enterica subsp. enterica serovar Halle]ECU4769204.1 hypothetical protein [Salmonella enterica subsp. enterica]EDQ1017439.1 hypothetical protein [Salmonella enterica subsp. houtenae serovar 50:z4,z23:-]EDV3252460.1 hypotheti